MTDNEIIEGNIVDETAIVPSDVFANLANYAPENVQDMPSGGISLPWLYILNSNSKYTKPPFNYSAGSMLLVQGDEIIELPENVSIHLVDTIQGRTMFAYDKDGKRDPDTSKAPFCGSNNGISPRGQYWKTEDGTVQYRFDPRKSFPMDEYKEVKKDPAALTAFINKMNDTPLKGVKVDIVQDGCEHCRLKDYIDVPKLNVEGLIETNAKGEIIFEKRAPLCQESPRYVLWIVELQRAAIYQARGTAAVYAKGRQFSLNADKSRNYNGKINGFPYFYSGNAPKWIVNGMPHPVILRVGTDNNNAANNVVYVPLLQLSNHAFSANDWVEYTKWADGVYKALNGHAVLSGDRGAVQENDETSSEPKPTVTEAW